MSPASSSWKSSLRLYVHTIPDIFCAGTKILPDRASVHHNYGDFGEISGTERSCAAPISKVERHASDRFCSTL